MIWSNSEEDGLMTDQLPRYAELREGCMYQGDGAVHPSARRALFLTAAAAFGFVLGALTAPEPAAPPSGPGYETCKTRGC